MDADARHGNFAAYFSSKVFGLSSDSLAAKSVQVAQNLENAFELKFGINLKTNQPPASIILCEESVAERRAALSLGLTENALDRSDDGQEHRPDSILLTRSLELATGMAEERVSVRPANAVRSLLIWTTNFRIRATSLLGLCFCPTV